jgi:hypothetical protein
MSSTSEFEINLQLLNEALVKLKSYYNNHTKKSSLNKATLTAAVELQALAIYVEKGSANQPAKDDEFGVQVWKALKKIENKATATDLAQNQFNKLFKQHQNEILTLARNN